MQQNTSAIKKKKIMPFLATWIVILSKPETKNTLYDTAYMWGLLKGGTNKHSSK